MLQGLGGQPGTKSCTSHRGGRPPQHSSLSAKRPPEMAQEPTAMAMRGSGTAAQVASTASRMLRLTGPVTRMPSA